MSWYFGEFKGGAYPYEVQRSENAVEVGVLAYTSNHSNPSNFRLGKAIPRCLHHPHPKQFYWLYQRTPVLYFSGKLVTPCGYTMIASSCSVGTNSTVPSGANFDLGQFTPFIINPPTKEDRRSLQEQLYSQQQRQETSRTMPVTRSVKAKSQSKSSSLMAATQASLARVAAPSVDPPAAETIASKPRSPDAHNSSKAAVNVSPTAIAAAAGEATATFTRAASVGAKTPTPFSCDSSGGDKNATPSTTTTTASSKPCLSRNDEAPTGGVVPTVVNARVACPTGAEMKAGRFHSCFVMSHGRQPTSNNNRC